MTRKRTFEAAVQATNEIENCYKPGLQALGSDSDKIHLTDNRECDGSVNIDGCLKAVMPNSNRWDYVISYKSVTYFVEVHPAQTSEVEKVLAKLQWLKNWLKERAPEIEKLKAEQPYYWIQSGRFNIPRTSRQYRNAASKGILIQSKLFLK